MSTLTERLYATTDAMVWAEEFMKVVRSPGVVVDEGLMVGWFANAMATQEMHLREPEPDGLHSVTICRLCLDGEGGECHVPGCSFWMHDAPSGDVLHALRTHLGENE